MLVARPLWHALVREPLVHFVAIGVLMFALDTSRDEREPHANTAARDPIVLDARADADIRARAERRLGRAPSADELETETDAWIDEEVLYREALARSLDRDDPEIHQRIAARMSFVLEQQVIVPEPTDAELRAWFDAHREQWSARERIDFTHVFVDGDDAAAHTRARELAATLSTGAAPERLGDRFAGGRRYRGRHLADLATAFGEDFARGLDAQPIGAWVERRSRFGIHLVRVERFEPGRAADFAAARLDVRRAWIEAHRAELLDAALARVRATWEIHRR
jgi:hypothetical protein